MIERLRLWDGEEWQKHINLLLHLHYGPGKYQEVPDAHVGDFGIEGFSATGVAYQCYAPQEPLSQPQLYEKQRDKITADIGKLIRNAIEIQKLLGGTRLNCWILMVPRFGSAKLVAHAEAKSAEVLGAKPPCVDRGFCVRIANDDLFARERAALAHAGAARVPAIDSSPDDAFFGTWYAEHNSLVGNVEHKIKKLRTITSESAELRFRDFIIRRYLAGQNVLEYMRQEYVELYEKVAEVKRKRETFLEGELLVNALPPNETLHEQRLKLEREFTDSVGEAVRDHAETLAWEAVSDWLLRCPLDF